MATLKQTRPRLDLLALVREFETAITSPSVLEDTLTLIAQRTTEALGAWECDLYEYHPETDALICSALWAREISVADLEWLGSSESVADRQAYRRILDDRLIVEYQLDDADLDPHERELMLKWGEKSVLTAPLVFGDQIIGCLVLLETRSVRHFSDEDRATIAALAVPAAIAIHNARMRRQQEEHTRRLTSLLEASRAITSSVVAEDVLALVAENAATTLGSPECVIFEHDAAAQTVEMRSYFAVPGFEDPRVADDVGIAYSLDEFPSDRQMLEEGVVVVEHASDTNLPVDVRVSMDYWNEKTCLTAPLRFRGQSLGMLTVIERDAERRFSDEEIELVRALGEQAAIALHNARLFERRAVENRRLVTLLEASQAITGSLDPGEVVGRVTEEIGSLFPGEETVATVWLRVDDDVYLPFLTGEPEQDGQANLALAGTPDETAAAAIATLTPVQSADPLKFHRMVVPLVLNHRAEGYLDVRSERREPFSEDEAHLVQILVNQAAVALENADNYGRLETMYLETVTALAAAMEAKDHYTAAHADMLASMAVSVGRHLGLSEGELRELQYAAVLHDIGKIGVPGHILNKPDKLTKDEFKQIAEHTIIGERIISRIEYLEPIARIIRAAHERWDGNGYPDKIGGDTIPLAARILLVCDAYHAMTSDRPYRAAMPDEHALRELERNAGTQFDPDVVEVFHNVWPDFEGTEPGLETKYSLPVWKHRHNRGREQAEAV